MAVEQRLTVKTRGADLKKLGHTRGNQYGQNPMARNPKRTAPTEMNAK